MNEYSWNRAEWRNTWMDINTHNVEAVETEAYNSYLLVVFQKLYRCCTHKRSHSDCGCLKVLCCIKIIHRSTPSFSILGRFPFMRCLKWSTSRLLFFVFCFFVLVFYFLTLQNQCHYNIYIYIFTFIVYFIIFLMYLWKIRVNLKAVPCDSAFSNL